MYVAEHTLLSWLSLDLSESMTWVPQAHRSTVPKKEGESVEKEKGAKRKRKKKTNSSSDLRRNTNLLITIAEIQVNKS